MNSITIAIAEDHKLFRQLLIPALLEFDIHTIAEAENGIELLLALETCKPDIILLDVAMPKMNGATAFLKIKALYPNQKIILLSMYYEEQLVNFFQRKGANAYLSKNSDIEVIVDVIQRVHTNCYVPETTTDCDAKDSVRFSQREAELIPLIIEGKSNKEIADSLSIGNKAVEAHKNSLFKKTKTKSAVGLVSFILKKGLNYLK